MSKKGKRSLRDRVVFKKGGYKPEKPNKLPKVTLTPKPPPGPKPTVADKKTS